MAEAKTEQEAQAQEALGVDDFSELLQKEFKPKSDRARDAVQGAVEVIDARERDVREGCGNFNRLRCQEEPNGKHEVGSILRGCDEVRSVVLLGHRYEDAPLDAEFFCRLVETRD